MLTTFGIFWGAEGAGAEWPGGDAAILVVLAFVLACSVGLVVWLDRILARRGLRGGSRALGPTPVMAEGHEPVR
jgi:hypothetical protein